MAQEPKKPAEPTDAQAAEAAGQPVPSEDARKVAADDAKWRQENPDQVRVREAEEKVGGESFDYLDAISFKG